MASYIPAVRTLLLQNIVNECTVVKPVHRQYSFPEIAGVYFVFEANDGVVSQFENEKTATRPVSP